MISGDERCSVALSERMKIEKSGKGRPLLGPAKTESPGIALVVDSSATISGSYLCALLKPYICNIEITFFSPFFPHGPHWNHRSVL